MNSSFWQNRKVLLSITSFRTDPFELIKQANELKIKEVALFLTRSDPDERKKLYECLEKSSISRIPCVHIKNDMEEWELNYLINKFKTEMFNVHTRKEFPLKNDLSKYKNKIFIENTHYFLDENEIKDYGGVCVDITHLERNKKLEKEVYEHNLSVLKKFKIGFNHISPFNLQNEKKSFNHYEEFLKKAHVVEDLKQFDYLKNYPENLFGPYLALETKSNLYEQVKIKEYIEKLL